MGNTTTRNFSVYIIKTVFKTTLLRLFSAKESGPKVWCAMVRDENPKHMKLISKQKCTNSKLYYHKLCVHHNPTTHARDVSKVNFASSDFFFVRVIGRRRTFISIGNAVKQLIHALCFASSSYDALGKFGELPRSSMELLSALLVSIII